VTELSLFTYPNVKATSALEWVEVHLHRCFVSHKISISLQNSV